MDLNLSRGKIMKIAIGCHIMWYEIEMVEEYVDSLIQLVGQVPEEEHKNIYIDLYYFWL